MRASNHIRHPSAPIILLLCLCLPSLLVAETKPNFVVTSIDDLGYAGPGCRPLGRVEDARPLISHDGQIREGFAAE